MLSAVYYPHTAVRDESFLKHALLYWDEIEYISPWQNFNALPRYSGETMSVLAQFLKPYVPNEQQKQQAHKEIMQMIDGPLPAWLQLDRNSNDEDRNAYYMFRDKLLPDTWRELQTRGVVRFARAHGDLDDYVSHTYLGLTLMAILARCCAGTLKHTITDQAESYETFLNHNAYLSSDAGPLDKESRTTFAKWLQAVKGEQNPNQDQERHTLVSITLEVINAESITVDNLVRIRSDKAALATLLRQNYANAVEEYVGRLSQAGLQETDAISLREDFRRMMELDMKRLYEELRSVATKTVLSKELAVALAAPAIGAAILVSTGVGVPLGSALAVGALLELRSEYRSSRETTSAKHPMAFLYSGKQARI